MSGNLKGSGGDIAPFSQSSFPWKKAISAVFIDGQHQLCPTAGYILAYNVTGETTGPGVLTIYDGHNVTDRIVWIDVALGNHAHGLVFATPIYCDKGIYIDVAITTHGMSVQWIPGPRL